MNSLTYDIWSLVLARLPIKIFTCFKLVCKDWKSIVESPFFFNLFMSLHQNSVSSSWSLMSIMSMDQVDPEMVGYYYQCDTWGLKRPLGSFIKSFLNDKNPNHKYLQVSAVAYSDVGLILIYATSKIMKNSSLYVANPVSHECVEIFIDPLPEGVERSQFCFWNWGIATRVENGILLGYNVVVFNRRWSDTKLSCLIYSSETGLWSLDTSFSNYHYSIDSISLNGSLHWHARNNDYQEVIVSMDFYTNNNNTGSDRCCRVTPFPDLERTTKFDRTCTPCHGFLMYMNIVYATKVDGGVEEKLRVWRLQREGWQLISEISLDGSILTGFDYSPMTINPLDAKRAYFWSTEQESLLYINLHNGKSVIYNQFELTSDGRTMIPAHDPRAVFSVKNAYFEHADLIPFVLPQWLYRIPNTPPLPVSFSPRNPSKLPTTQSNLNQESKQTLPEKQTWPFGDQSDINLKKKDQETLDECPICLEEYHMENPRLLTKYRHDFHLACILEWMERSEACPVCDKELVLPES
ncbi:hypothetical protein N665_1046s0021 [Sinapis alba]|nr:hypothetical protein N665_1046s0021 [Sinapis alba]